MKTISSRITKPSDTAQSAFYGALVSVSLTWMGVAIMATNAEADPIIADGTFENPIGIGTNLTPWSDWTDAGITRSPMPDPLLGNYASLPVGSDLFQWFSGPAAGQYTLSFLAQNQSPNPAELVISVQNPLGGIPPEWMELAQVIDLPASSLFTLYTYTFDVTEPQGTVTELYFSNSYDDPDSSAGVPCGGTLQPCTDGSWPGPGSVNPSDTVINVADVALTPTAPIPAALPLFATGLGALGLLSWRRKRKASAALA